MGGCVAGMTAAWIAAVVFVAAGRPLAAQNSRWGADYFPNVVLTTHEGKPVRFYDDLIKGKIVAINLIYTTCKFACPLETARLAQVYKLVGDRMGRDVFFYSISIDPENDTPAVLKAYAEKFHAGPGWLFLTGKKGEIDAIGRKLGIYSDPGTSADGHTPHLLIGNEATGQWIRNNGLDNPRFLATTIDSWLNSWQTAAKPTKSYADAPTIKIDAGEYAFKTHCAPCHTVGRGDQIGPDLLGVTTRRDRAWLTRFIIAPDRMIAEGDATATALLAKYKQVAMPSLGLARSDADLLLDYLAKQQAPAAAAASAVVAPPAPPAPKAKASASASALLEPYLVIQRALSADRTDAVADRARTIAAEAAKLGPAGETVRAAAAALSTRASSLEAARTAFDRLSVALVRYSTTNNVGLDARIGFCPMVGKYWLQQGQSIRNPYYGASMLECGRFVDRIPADYK
jgi:protein SCO1/2